MAIKTIQDRRKLRSLEAKRDKLLETIKAAKAGLASTRADIKHQRGTKVRSKAL